MEKVCQRCCIITTKAGVSISDSSSPGSTWIVSGLLLSLCVTLFSGDWLGGGNGSSLAVFKHSLKTYFYTQCFYQHSFYYF